MPSDVSQTSPSSKVVESRPQPGQSSFRYQPYDRRGHGHASSVSAGRYPTSRGFTPASSLQAYDIYRFISGNVPETRILESWNAMTAEERKTWQLFKHEASSLRIDAMSYLLFLQTRIQQQAQQLGHSLQSWSLRSSPPEKRSAKSHNPQQAASDSKEGTKSASDELDWERVRAAVEQSVQRSLETGIWDQFFLDNPLLFVPEYEPKPEEYFARLSTPESSKLKEKP